ncbi:flagellar hook-associated protein FlgL [Psychromonas marina]|uniref:Flagellar hook-associated protein FlgL n=1 Tax=Psychromonas marina TaxID=88364 RepID=A0ABQ6DVX8_9GAMM|nr:flagellar hook-associated protein FlgL [Psychromonas marina]GLS89282.1 flagellar hook-associated protein FlgL [Psychromonas marina]
MRISTQVFFQRNMNSVMGQQSSLNQQNMHLSEQKRVLNGSDDPVAIATIQRLKQDVSVGEQYLKNADIAESANALEDTALSQTTNILQRVREIMVTAGNETYDGEGREAMAKELEGLREELVGVANTKDGNSQYIFAGFQVDTQPFQSDEFGDIDYHGDGGGSKFRVGPGVLVQGYDSGAALFTQIPEGNGTFVSEVNQNNSGSGVISEGAVIDSKLARDFVDQDYTVTVSTVAPGDEPEYSVYGLDDSGATGNASVKIAAVDLNNAAIGNVNPAGVYPSVASDVNINFIESPVSSGVFELQINGVSSLPALYDSTNSSTQQITIDGISIDVNGVPDDADQYKMTKFIEPTTYQEGQSIEFNGIKTEIKGEVQDLDSFTLRQSGEKDIFTTIQQSIDALRMPGSDDATSAQRAMVLMVAHQQVDNAMSNVSNIHTSVGGRLNTIDNQREATLDFNLTNQKTLSSLEDLDMAAAISEFQMQMSMLEISQQTFVQMQSLSLFKLI